MTKDAALSQKVFEGFGIIESLWLRVGVWDTPENPGLKVGKLVLIVGLYLGTIAHVIGSAPLVLLLQWLEDGDA